MDRGSWFFAGGIVKAPIGLVLPFKDGLSIDPDWALWSTANAKFLCGTESDAVVGTTGARTGLSTTSGGGGGHSAASTLLCNHGSHTTAGCGSNCNYPTSTTDTRGSHSGHSVSVSYKPAYAGIRLIQAQAKAPIPIGAVMLGDTEHPSQSAFTALNTSRLLYADTATTAVAQSASVSAVGSQSDYHNHVQNIWKTSWGIYTTYTSQASAGGSHSHSASLSASHNLYRRYLKAFEIIDNQKIKGLIGLWPSTGLPSKWELVGGMTNRYAEIRADLLGTDAGNGTVSYSGSLGNVSHAHGVSGSLYCEEAGVGHSGSVSHGHSFSAAQAYSPERYYIKFIRYAG